MGGGEEGVEGAVGRGEGAGCPPGRAAGQGPAELAAAPPRPPTAEQTEQQPGVEGGRPGPMEAMITFISVAHPSPGHLHPTPPWHTPH